VPLGVNPTTVTAIQLCSKGCGPLGSAYFWSD